MRPAIALCGWRAESAGALREVRRTLRRPGVRWGLILAASKLLLAKYERMERQCRWDRALAAFSGHAYLEQLGRSLRKAGVRQ